MLEKEVAVRAVRVVVMLVMLAWLEIRSRRLDFVWVCWWSLFFSFLYYSSA
jgi:hypothetical protein